MTQTDATLKTILQKMIATSGPYDPAATYLGVATALTNNGAATAQSDVTEATGAMATRKLITAWGTPYKLADGRWVVEGPLSTFVPASSAQAQTLSHWFLNSASTAGTLKAFKPISPPRDLPDETKAYSIIVRLTIDPAGNFDATVDFDG